MLEPRSGVIVEVVSVAGRNVSLMNRAHCTAATAGLLGLTRHLAREFVGRGFRVNPVTPAATETPLLRKTLDPEEITELAGRTLMGRLAKPEKIAPTILFLTCETVEYRLTARG